MRTKIFLPIFIAIVSSAAFADEEEIQSGEDLQMEEQSIHLPDFKGLEGGLILVRPNTCGGPEMSDLYSEALQAFEGARTGKVTIKRDSVLVQTKFLDVNCPAPGQSVVIQFENGGELTLTSYFGPYLPSPTWSPVRAFIGNITLPEFSVANSKFWLDSNSNLGGLQLFGGNSYFQLSSSWYAL